MLEYLHKTPSFKRWNKLVPETQKDDLKSFQSYIVRLDQALCLSDLLWPDFIEEDGLLLRLSAMPDDWDEYLHEARSSNWSDSDIEYVINHVHIYDVFINDPDRDEIPFEAFKAFAELVTEMWKCKLLRDLPQHQFEVGVQDVEGDLEVFAYSIKD
jgi:hypothetical protein